MSRLHKKNKLELEKKYYIIFTCLIIFGFYKNGIVVYRNNYISLFKLILLFLMPILTIIIGYVFDKFTHNEDIFNNVFLSLLFLLFIPISCNIFIYLIYLIGILALNNFVLKNKVKNINIIVLEKLLLSFILVIFGQYNYMNNLEISNQFEYLFLDKIIGFNVSSIYTSSILLLLASYFFLCSDYYYKREIPLISYSIYIISLLLYSLKMHSMSYILSYALNPTVLASLILLAAFSYFSPCRKKSKILYAILIGIIILPLSNMFSFEEGVFLAIIIANLVINLIIILSKKRKSPVEG